MRVVSVARFWDTVRATFWVLPALCVVGAVGLAIGLLTLDRFVGAVRVVFLFPGPPEGARSFLSAIIQAMIAFTGLVFSITIVVLQLTSSQFSPRVLRHFLRDRFIQFALGLFVATFVYAMVVLRGVRGGLGHDPFVPRIAVTVALVFVLASVGMFIGYISHIAEMIRVASIIDVIGKEAVPLLERCYPREGPEQAAGALPPLRGTVTAPTGGVLVHVNEGALVSHASRAGCVIELTLRVGNYAPAGSPLARVRATGDCLLPDAAVLDALGFDKERTMEQDLAFAFRQLVDIAERALSPAVNDPTTAAQCLDVMHDLLRRLAVRPCTDVALRRDGPGQLRLIVPRFGFADFLDLTIHEIWRYGSQDAQIPARIRALLEDLRSAALPAHLSSVEAWQARLQGDNPEVRSPGG